MEKRTRALLPGHWMIAEAQVALGERLAERRRYAEAEQPLVEGHAAYSSRLGPQVPRTSTARQSLAALYETWGKPDATTRLAQPIPE